MLFENIRIYAPITIKFSFSEKVTKMGAMVLSHTTTEEKCGMDFSPSSGEAMSGEKKFPYESRVAEPRVTNREICHATFLLSGGVP